MTFEAEFFGPGNRLKWDAILTGSLPADVQHRLGPFLEDMRRNPDVLTLPRVRENGEVLWYVLCRSPRAARTARDEVRAFLGPTYSNFDGRPTRFDSTDPVEAAVLARYGNNAFRIEVPDRAVLDAARERLRLLIRLHAERPARYGRRIRAAGRVLRDFEYALITGNDTAAADSIDELRIAGHLSATNLVFLEVRRLAAAERWDAILTLPELDALVAMARPRRVTEAIIRAIYASRLREFEEGGRASEAVERFRSELYPRFRDLYRSRAGLSGYTVDASFLMAAATSVPAHSDVVNGILQAYAPDSSEAAYLRSLAALVTPPAAGIETNRLYDAHAAFAEADVDRAYELAGTLSPSFDRSALLLRCAGEMGTLSAAQTALASLEDLPSADRLRIDRNVLLRRIRDSLQQLSASSTQDTTAAAAVELLSTWSMWLRRLSASEPWAAAVMVAETAAREWSIESFVDDPAAIQEVANLLIEERPTWGQAALRDSLPHLLQFYLTKGPVSRLRPVYESLFLVIAVDDHVSLPQASALLRVVDARLQLGVTSAEYGEILTQLASAIYAIESPSVASLALDALETVINAACPLPSERQEFLARVAAIFQRWHRRIDKVQFALLRQLAGELGLTNAIPSETAEPVTEQHALSYWAELDGRRIALYSLQESALRRAVSVISQLSPTARISTFHDHVGGSPALRKASTTADLFILATAAAKHSATTFIEANRPSGLPTLYARGQGSASLLDVLREHLQRSVDDRP